MDTIVENVYGFFSFRDVRCTSTLAFNAHSNLLYFADVAAIFIFSFGNQGHTMSM